MGVQGTGQPVARKRESTGLKQDAQEVLVGVHARGCTRSWVVSVRKRSSRMHSGSFETRQPRRVQPVLAGTGLGT
jgi:hypothetical protein